jgi:hypothetical protein
VGDPAQFGHITQFIRQISVNQSAAMNGRRCPFCHSDSSRVVGIRVDSWAKCQNCRSVFRDITPARVQQIHDEAFVSFPSSAGLAAGARPAAWGLRLERVWSTGLRFEFPIAARDHCGARRGIEKIADQGHAPAGPGSTAGQASPEGIRAGSDR